MVYLLFSALFSLFLTQCFATPLVRLTQYNEDEARMLLNLSAGAYSHMPETCMNRTMPQSEQWMLYSEPNAICDQRSSLCSGYIIRSDIAKRIILIFRGTRTTEQLLTEAWQGIQPGNDFYGIGKVNRYFSQALDTLWPHFGPMLKDPMFKNYPLSITGHSLGGALAAMAAAKIVMEGLRTGDEIRVVTFGQPRIGDRDFAFKYDEMIKYSFRVVHRLDIVPHLPACEKDKDDIETRWSDSKKCDPTVTGHAYHHGTEIWYPYGMKEGAEYFECLGLPKNEDFACSDSLNFELSKRSTYVDDHRHYFDRQVPNFGKLGCEDIAEDSASLPAGESLEATTSQSVFKKVVSKVQTISRMLGISG